MARPSKHNWVEIEDYYRSGMPSPQICKKFGISKSSLSERIKQYEWVVSEQITELTNNAAMAVKSISELPKGQQRAVTEIIEEKLRFSSLINGNAELIASKIPAMLNQIDSPSDLKILAEANDRLAITLKVADRHAKSGDVNVSTTAAVQNNVTVNKEEVKGIIDAIEAEY